MKNLIQNFKYSVAASMAMAAGLAFTLSACGDDVTEIHQDGMSVLEKGKKLDADACKEDNAGDMVYVADSSAAFVCDGESWQTMNGADGKSDEKAKDSDAADWSCSSKQIEKKGRTGFVFTCGDAVVDTIWNGKDGENGLNGDACKATKLDATKDHKNGGFKITCGKDSYELWNGENGKQGEDGKSAYELSGSELSQEEWIESLKGLGCTSNDDGKGSVTVVCGEAEPITLYKAVCGTKPYDPAKSFCSEGKPYSCNEKPYDPKKQYCLKVTRDETDIYSVEDLLTDARDEQHVQVYKTVKIGNQTWMAENLNYSVDPGKQSWCHDDNAENCSMYGRLYTWAAAVGKTEAECGREHECDLTDPVQGVCPEGWHLPNMDEWNALITVAGENGVGTMLKSTSGWNNKIDGSNGNGTDSYGFGGVPAGFRYAGGSFSIVGNIACFWSSHEIEADFASYWSLNDEDEVSFNDRKDLGLSVRCLRN